MLFLDVPPFICPSLLSLMSPVTGSSRCFAFGGCELNTLTSKNVLLLPLSHKFWAFISNLAPSSVLVLLCGKVSFVSGCRAGSMATFGPNLCKELCEQVPYEVRPNRWLSPLEQLSAWLRLTVSPHARFEGSLSSCHPYLTHKASLNACLWRLNPYS